MAEQNVKTGAYNFEGENANFAFYTSLSALQKAKFVNSVADLLVGDNYLYVIKDLIFDFCIVDTFSDVDMSFAYNAGLELDLDVVEEFIDGTTVVNIIKINAEDGVIEELEKAVSLAVEYRTGIHSNPINESLSSLLNTIEKKFAAFDVDGMMDMAGAFSGLTGDITPEKMLDAYAKSDVFKGMHEDVVAKQEKRDAAMDVINANIGSVVKGGKSAASSPLLSPLM